MKHELSVSKFTKVIFIRQLTQLEHKGFACSCRHVNHNAVCSYCADVMIIHNDVEYPICNDCYDFMNEK